jgi:hypothetical protein
MTTYSSYLVYPDGDRQDAAAMLRINQLVDINGNPLALPLRTTKMIVYRVYKMTKNELRGEETTNYYLELVRRDELEDMAAG